MKLRPVRVTWVRAKSVARLLNNDGREDVSPITRNRMYVSEGGLDATI